MVGVWPGVVAGEVDVFPAQGREEPQQIRVNGAFVAVEGGDGAVEVDRVLGCADSGSYRRPQTTSSPFWLSMWGTAGSDQGIDTLIASRVVSDLVKSAPQLNWLSPVALWID